VREKLKCHEVLCTKTFLRRFFNGLSAQKHETLSAEKDYRTIREKKFVDDVDVAHFEAPIFTQCPIGHF
jgi:hypothetical protein